MGEFAFAEKWSALSVSELRKFLSDLRLIEVSKSKNEPIGQLWSLDHGGPVFNLIMSRTRFQQLTSMPYFDDVAAEVTSSHL